MAYLFEGEIGGKAEEVGVGEFREGTEVLDRLELKDSATEVIDGLGLVVADIGMSLQLCGFDIVNGDGAQVFGVDGKMVGECVEVKCGEGGVG